VCSFQKSLEKACFLNARFVNACFFTLVLVVCNKNFEKVAIVQKLASSDHPFFLPGERRLVQDFGICNCHVWSGLGLFNTTAMAMATMQNA